MNNNYLNPNLTAADNVLTRQQMGQMQMPIQQAQQMQLQQQFQQAQQAQMQMPQASAQMPTPQQMFIQPSGNVYQLNSSAEIDLVPVGNNMVSIGLCMEEGVLQIKTLQNGIPVVAAYDLASIDATQLAARKAAKQNKTASLEDRISKLENTILQIANTTTNVNKEGADVSWQI